MVDQDCSYKILSTQDSYLILEKLTIFNSDSQGAASNRI